MPMGTLPGSHQAPEVATELVVAGEEKSGKLRHDYSTRRITVGNAPVGTGTPVGLTTPVTGEILP